MTLPSTFAESIVETMREPLLVLDSELRVKKANRSFFRAFQVTLDQTEDKFIYDLGHGVWNIPVLRTLLEEILLRGTIFEDFEVSQIFPIIGHKTMLLNARCLVSDEQFPSLILLAIEDITERKQAELKLKAFAAELERSNRELQDFASVAAHDLQEPLRKIQNFAADLMEGYAENLDSEGCDILGRMQSAAGRMRKLIDDLLSFSRVTTKAQPFAPVDLNLICQEVIIDLQEHIDALGGRVEVEPLPTIEADSLQMGQLLQNLLGNALKYHQPNKPPLVKIWAEMESACTPRSTSDSLIVPEQCRIFVADNGIGFDEKYLDRIFVIFQRLHGRHEYEGTGIGLAICRKIVERHQGQITARSAPGAGATFVVTLPINQKEEIL